MATDDEITAAADRLRALPADYPWQQVNLTSQAWADCRTLARAYLDPWRPISEAPRDGTRVLLGWDDPTAARPLVGYWSPRWAAPDGWANDEGDFLPVQPTHWTDLPRPPCQPPPLPSPPAPAA